jgi:hypothetical protein
MYKVSIFLLPFPNKTLTSPRREVMITSLHKQHHITPFFFRTVSSAADTLLRGYRPKFHWSQNRENTNVKTRMLSDNEQECKNKHKTTTITANKVSAEHET